MWTGNSLSKDFSSWLQYSEAIWNEETISFLLQWIFWRFVLTTFTLSESAADWIFTRTGPAMYSITAAWCALWLFSWGKSLICLAGHSYDRGYYGLVRLAVIWWLFLTFALYKTGVHIVLIFMLSSFLLKEFLCLNISITSLCNIE